MALVYPSYHNGKTGLIEATGSCTFIPNADDGCSNLGETLLYSIGFGIPTGVILLSYLVIFVKVQNVNLQIQKAMFVCHQSKTELNIFFKIRKMELSLISDEERKTERVCKQTCGTLDCKNLTI